VVVVAPHDVLERVAHGDSTLLATRLLFHLLGSGARREQIGRPPEPPV
jgi:hypothetical protein